MHQNRFFFFTRQSFQSFVWILLVSICLTVVILIIIVPSDESMDRIKLKYCSREGFIYDLNLISPRRLGVNEWQVGDYAHYQYRRKQSPDSDQLLFDQEVGFHIVGELEKPDSHGYWLKKTGFTFSQVQTIPLDFYQLVTVDDLRITPENPAYEDPLNYFPSRFTECEQTNVSLAKLVKLGDEKIKTRAGTFDCIHYRAELEWHDNFLEIWVSAAIPPLGIVRAHSPTEVLELISFGQDTEVTASRLIQPVLEGISTLNHGCNSCHGHDNCHEMFFPPK